MYKAGEAVKFTDACPWTENHELTYGIVLGYLDPEDVGTVQKQPDGPTFKDCIVAVAVAEYLKGLGYQTKTYFVQEVMVEAVPADAELKWKEADAPSAFEDLLAEVGEVPPKQKEN